MLLPFRLSSYPQNERRPLTLYNIGCHGQHHILRPSGYLVPQCFVVFEGTGRVDFKDGSHLLLEAGDALLLPKGLAHEYYPLSDSPWLVGYIGFKGTAAEEIVSGCGLPLCTVIRLKDTRLLRIQLEALWERADQPDPLGAAVTSTRLYEFMLQLSEQAETAAATSAVLHGTPAEEALRQAAGYMQEHYSEPLLMSNIAHTVGYSVQHFQRIFKEGYGVTPHAYLQRIRLRQASLWLEGEPGLSIKEIAGRLGLEPNYFVRAFKKAYGISPGIYRDEVTGAADHR